MSINLKLDGTDFVQPKEKQVKMQYMPVGVEETCVANVDEYFNNYTTEVDGCKYSCGSHSFQLNSYDSGFE